MSGHKARRAIAWGVAVVVLGVIVVGSLVPNVDALRAAGAKNDVQVFCDASVEFRADEGRWPENIYELLQRNCPPGAFCCGGDLDVWGNEYVIVTDRDRVTVTCYGADGTPGGDGVDADIVFSRSFPPTD